MSVLAGRGALTRLAHHVTNRLHDVPATTDIALLTDARYTADRAPDGDWYLANILADDGLLRDALAAHGFTAHRVDWADPTIDWSRFRAAVFRTTWDYVERIDEFRAWLDRAERATRLINAPGTIRWNLDKHYLADLDERGVPPVPTVYLEAGDDTPLATLLARHGWTEGVIKPCISGTARLTNRVTHATARDVEHSLAPYRARESFLVQPFVSDVLANGEVTLVVIDGVVTHAVRKRPKPGDFRVQDDHGGTWAPHEPSAEEVAFAERAIAACTPRPVYGRVDVVRGADGTLQIMELELIEPELWLRAHPEAAERMAGAIVERLREEA